MQQATPPISVEIVDLPPLAELEPEWRDLQRRTPHSFFNSWAWIGSWLESLPPRVRPRLIRARAHGRVVALATLCERVVTRGGVVRSRTLSLNSTADPRLDELTIEHNGLLCERGIELRVFDSFLKILLESDSWDEIRIDGLDQIALLDAVPMGSLKPIVDLRPEYFVDLDAVRSSGKGYLDALPPKIRSQLRHSLRDCPGNLVFETASTVSRAQAFMRDLKRLHTQSWEAKNGTGAFANEYFDKFHEDLIVKRFGEGVVEVSRLSVSDRPVGYVYNFLYQGIVYAYQSGFDLNFDKRSSWRPGLLSHMFAIEAGLARGHRVYSFLAGESRYKRHMSRAAGRMAWVVLQRPRLKFRLETMLRHARDRLKK
jgi:CelD/BcsL family acetyltransferase involved in cellulose biosynthesis